MKDCNKLPDGSSFFTAEMPLPKDHWLYQKEYEGAPPMPLLMGKSHEIRKSFEIALRKAGKYALRVSTQYGQESLDPDAFLQNLIVGFLGYHTETGLGGEDWMDPPHLRTKEPK